MGQLPVDFGDCLRAILKKLETELKAW